MHSDHGDEPRPMWQRLLSLENPDWFARVLVSLVAASALAGAALLVLGVVEALLPPSVISYTQPDGRVVTYTVSRVDDEIVAAGLAGAGVAWCLLLPWIWRGYHRFRTGLKSLFQTLAIWVCAIPVCLIIDKAMRNEELWIATVILMASALTLLVFARAYARLRAGKPVVNAAGEVDVRCPQCGYSLIGLGESRCPECGKQYTLDELIRLQGYSRASLRASASASTPPTRFSASA